jgi:hypothetical protein
MLYRDLDINLFWAVAIVNHQREIGFCTNFFFGITEPQSFVLPNVGDVFLVGVEAD